ncbi:MAG: FprA family A-type flavoprotein [Candidatus Omnitrophica bacterium]|nr:FprA family A-type flavoprotein [Candidatus Omnitrophota bacterium]
MAKILIVYYSLGGNTKEAAEIVKKAVESTGHKAVMKTGLEADLKDLLECDGIAIGTPDYFSYMAGGLKDFFDRTLYPSRGKVEDKPYFAFVTHGGGGKAIDSVERIAQSFNFKKAAEPVLIKNSPDSKARKLLEETVMKFLAAL